jgi:RNA polymerase primary sigma factor
MNFFKCIEGEDFMGKMKSGNRVANKDPNSLQIYFNQIKAFPLLTFEEEKSLSRLILAGDEAAKTKLIESNLRLVVTIAKSYHSEIPFLDRIQSGNMGLIKAASKYDYRKNVRFSTYGVWWIRQSIERGFADDRAIRLPFRKYEQLKMLTKENYHFLAENGRFMTDEEMFKEFKITSGELGVLLSAHPNLISSLDKDVVVEGNYTPNQMGMKDERYLSETEFFKKDMRENVYRALDALPEKERFIIMGRNGFNGDGKKTLKTLGEEMGITRERVRQIEVKAMRRLKNSFDVEKLREYLES